MIPLVLSFIFFLKKIISNPMTSNIQFLKKIRVKLLTKLKINWNHWNFNLISGHNFVLDIQYGEGLEKETQKEKKIYYQTLSKKAIAILLKDPMDLRLHYLQENVIQKFKKEIKWPNDRSAVRTGPLLAFDNPVA